MSNEDSQPFLPDDDVPNVFLEDLSPMNPTKPARIYLKITTTGLIILWRMGQRNARLATTRLLRVRCYTVDGHNSRSLNHTEISEEYTFNVGDLAIALIRTHNTVAAAVVMVTVLENKNKLRVDQVDVEDLGGPDSEVTVTAQLLCLQDILIVGGGGIESTRKWVWAGEVAQFEPLNGAASTVDSGTRRALTVKIPGALVHPLDAELEGLEERMMAKRHTKTYTISQSDFAAVVSAMYERLDVTPLLQLLPKHGKSANFPYTKSSGEFAFILQSATQAFAQK
ncbi:hypothetical protein C8J57DRAFT_1518033 [Mycena rebaudengoi]|nr:hypothetical protein C8J57DRAFT_1518033 [Mycena rebaudengoi]